MNNLFIYGCSHSAGNCLGFHHPVSGSFPKPNPHTTAENIVHYETEYTKWLGKNGIPFYINLSNKLNRKYILRAEAGNSNQQQFNKLLNDLELIKKNDIVIFQFTHFIRFAVPYINDNRWSIDGWQKGGSLIFDSNAHQNFYISYLDFEEWYIIQIVDQILTLLEYINNKIGAKVYFWSMDPIPSYLNDYTNIQQYKNLIKFKVNDIEYNCLNDVTDSFNRNKNFLIKYETNGEVDDSHFGQIGHNFMYENILKFIENNVNCINEFNKKNIQLI